MAKTKYPTPATALTAGELHITLYARQHDTWRGTAEQPTNAGLIPDEFKWPSRTERLYFTHNGIDCAVQRERLPGGTRGQSWVGVDNWQLMRYCAGRGNGGAALFEKEQAFRQELWRRSAEGQRLCNRYWVAHNDAGFQAFKRRALGLGKAGASGDA